METGTELVSITHNMRFGDALLGVIDADIAAEKIRDEDSREYKAARRRSSQRWRALVRVIDRHSAAEVKRVVKSLS